MSETTARLHHWDEVPLEAVGPMLDRQIVSCERMMISQIHLKQGALVPRHSHLNEQITYMLKGALKFWIGEQGETVFIARPGDVVTIPSNVPHRAEALEDTLEIDIFNPPRQDWLDKTDSYIQSGVDDHLRG
ncbi:cupin domain-containing protein [Paucibacter sp. KBW04]|uniref:cupin domain-containing protein n=1 Tax=Paucibacter sp. KBW04 TaxID=2153361 RepID=UPI000F56B1E5|nr:cupin domain-containing protein [Paucibacter sp. KBW04]RQO59713.1 cupin domain-containing protein [Paucibacter sp. KBW04]